MAYVSRRFYKPRRFRTRRRGYNRLALRSRVWSRRTPRYRVTRKGFRSLRFNKVKRPLGGFAPRLNITLRYVESVSLNPTDGGSAVNVFRVNNIFDPNFSGVGHQPMFYDNYAQLYSKYKVNYATITMIPLANHMVNTTTTSTTSGTSTADVQYFAANERAARMFILVDESPTDYPSDLDNLIEEGTKKLRWRYAPQNTSAFMQKLSFRCYPHKEMNLSFRDGTLAADFNNAPARNLYFICGVDGFDGYNADAMRYTFMITYNVTVFDFIGNQTQN